MDGPLVKVNFLLALDGSCSVRSVSDGIMSLFGFHSEEILASRVNLCDLIHPEDADTAAALFSPQIEPRSGCFNIRLRHADGGIRCIKGHFSKGPDDAGGGVSLCLELEDARNVTESGDTALPASFRTLIEASEDYIYVKNRNHVFLAASPNVCKLTTEIQDSWEVVGKTDYDIQPEEIADIGYRLEKQAIAEGRRTNQLQQLPSQDGTSSWIDNRKYPINNGTGEIIGILGIAPDMTAQVEAELKLRDSEEALSEAQKIAGVGSYVLNVPANVWTSSRVLDEIMGIDQEYERTTEGWLTLVHPEDRAAMAEYLRNHVLGQGKPFDREYRIIRRCDGAATWVHGLGKLELDRSGRPALMRGTIQDITEARRSKAALNESKELLQLFIENAPADLAMFDRELRFLSSSRRWIESFSPCGQEVIGRFLYDVLPDIPEEWKEQHRRALAGTAFKGGEDRYERADGRVQWVKREIIPWRTADGSVGGIIAFSEDITQQKKSEERTQLAASLFTHAREGVVITDAQGSILEVNEAFIRLSGYSREEVLGHNPRFLKSGLQGKEFYEQMWRTLLETGHWSGELWNRAKDGEIYAETMTINALRNGNGDVVQYVALFTDITEMKEHARELEQIAHYDGLTGLPNRILLADRLRQAMSQAHRRAQSLAVAILDVDNFKAVNDRYGRATGDALLAALAARLKCVLREGDTLARLGGDEFAVVILDLEKVDNMLPFLTRLQEVASAEVPIDGQGVRFTSSMGVTFYPQPEQVDEDQLVRQADQAMYQAKLAGRNCHRWFDPSEDLTVRGHRENLEHIRRALTAREFVLHYQPKVNMRTGEVTGLEALIRWHHPQRGLLPPGLFLPVIEGHPLSIELGEWVIETALEQMETWHAEGLDIPVSVNVGALQLQQPNFVDRLRALLAAHPAALPGNLELEVIETTALEDLALTSQALNACRAIGVAVALDDFGTGYSSLTYLKRLPVNVLKIDRSFVSDMLEDPENLSILEGVLGLAAAFRLQVIAEGVETAEHGLMLLQLGCELAQGYGIARPMPAKDLPAWARAWRSNPRWAAVPQVNSGNRQALFASVEHRAWLAAFEAWLQGKRHTAPALDARQCRFGTWLESEGQLGRGTQPAFQAIESVHHQFHALAAKISSLHTGGRSSEGLARLSELHGLRDELMKQLAVFKGNH
jgi:diguanylate cyclase (GGDEF)-like protein/PAS domain S-box-containing protein